MRAELGKIEAQFDKFNTERVEVESRFPSIEDTTLGAMFAELVGKSLQQCKGVGLAYLQAEASSRSVIKPRDTASTTKKETVMLPSFSRQDDTAYLKYPVWRKQWALHITNHEER